MHAIYFAALFAFLKVSGVQSSYRIIGGTETTVRDVPYIARIEKFNIHVCGATIISKNWVVTTGHCMANKTVFAPHPLCMLRIRVGSQDYSDGDIYGVKRLVIHEDYIPMKVGSVADIALLQSETDFILGDKVKTIAILERIPGNGEMGVVAGYGRTTFLSNESPTPDDGPHTLKTITLPVVDLPTCRQQLGILIPDDMICAGGTGEDSCTGDSGGPLVIEGKAAAVVSWGIGCGSEGRPGAYTALYPYKDWIDITISINEDIDKQSGGNDNDDDGNDDDGNDDDGNDDDDNDDDGNDDDGNDDDDNDDDGNDDDGNDDDDNDDDGNDEDDNDKDYGYEPEDSITEYDGKQTTEYSSDSKHKEPHSGHGGAHGIYNEHVSHKGHKGRGVY